MVTFVKQITEIFRWPKFLS